KEYRIRLEASFKCINWLLKHGLSFRGHDESEESNNRGLFLSLLEFYASDIEHVKSVVLENAPKNQQMTSPDIQKDIVHALALETTKLITVDIGDDFFAILQMGLVLRYVDGKRCVIERFLGISHVRDTKAVSLKKQFNLCYNMKGEINGLKTLIFEESPSAYYIHYLVHRLQLTIVVVAQNRDDVNVFFVIVGTWTKLVGHPVNDKTSLEKLKQTKLHKLLL
ncbi:hypothetical protein LINPERPRIM_LOCUS37643, partial [Linum perenne]